MVLVMCRFANISVGLQEKLVLRRKAQEAMEKGQPLPDIPGIREALEDKELEAALAQINEKNRNLGGGKGKGGLGKRVPKKG